MKTSELEKLTVEDIKQLSPRQVYFLFTAVRAKISHIYNHYDCLNRCCEECCEYIGSDEEWEENVVAYAEPLEKVQKLLKNELNLRPYARLTKAQREQARKEKLSNLKGNKRRKTN